MRFSSAQAQSQPSTDAQAWGLVQNTSSEAVLDDFIRRFPDTVYGGFARARLDELKRDNAAFRRKTKSSWWARLWGQRQGESFKDCGDCPEMVAVPGKESPFWWGSSITPDQANYNGNYVYKGGGEKGADRQRTTPVKLFQPNPWGLYQVHGNVWEWVEDCWHDNYNGAPADGSAWTIGACGHSVTRGRGWSGPGYLRAAARIKVWIWNRSSDTGFRVARGLD